MPEISIIVPVYNVEKYLHRCIDSILAQTFNDFELILIDDGSTDSSGSICEEYKKIDPRIYVIHQKNRGLSVARNTGLDWIFKNSDSKWLTFIDSDDWVHNKYLELLYSASVKYQVSLSICGYQETSGESPFMYKQEPKTIICSPEKFYLGHTANATIAWGKLYRNDCFKKIRYPVGKIHEDEYITYRILFSLQEIAIINMPLYAYFFNQDGITKSDWSPKRMDIFNAYEGQISFFKKRGMYDLMNLCIGTYLWNVEQQMKEFEAVKKNYGKKAEKELKRRLGWILLRWRNKYPFEKNKKRYETAFPKMMWVYWYIQGIKYKLKRE